MMHREGLPVDIGKTTSDFGFLGWVSGLAIDALEERNFEGVYGGE